MIVGVPVARCPDLLTCEDPRGLKGPELNSDDLGAFGHGLLES